jgi:hypothetical protein
MANLALEIALILVGVVLAVIALIRADRLVGTPISYASQKFGNLSIEPVPFFILLAVTLCAGAGWLMWQDQKIKEKAAEEAQIGLEKVKEELSLELQGLKSDSLTVHLDFNAHAPDPDDAEVIPVVIRPDGRLLTLSAVRPELNPQQPQTLIVHLDSLHAGELLALSVRQKKTGHVLQAAQPIAIAQAAVFMGDKP